tara:strand:- start:1516 stop:1725 length:210 start_codon:yes stop_codon:yes gene_type:complete
MGFETTWKQSLDCGFELCRDGRSSSGNTTSPENISGGLMRQSPRIFERFQRTMSLADRSLDVLFMDRIS